MKSATVTTVLSPAFRVTIYTDSHRSDSQSLTNNLVDSARSAVSAKIKGGGVPFDVVTGALGPGARRCVKFQYVYRRFADPQFPNGPQAPLEIQCYTPPSVCPSVPCLRFNRNQGAVESSNLEKKLDSEQE